MTCKLQSKLPPSAAHQPSLEGECSRLLAMYNSEELQQIATRITSSTASAVEKDHFYTIRGRNRCCEHKYADGSYCGKKRGDPIHVVYVFAKICPSCGSTNPGKMGDSEPCRNQYHANAGFPRDPSDNAVRDTRGQ